MAGKRDHGDGGIDQRGENAWRLRWRVNGKRYSKAFHGTKAAAQKELRRLLKAADDGEHVAPDKGTLAGWVERWIALQERRNGEDTSEVRKRGLVNPRTLERYADVGWVAERFKAPVLKTGGGVSSSWVRIPPHPPRSARSVAARWSRRDRVRLWVKRPVGEPSAARSPTGCRYSHADAWRRRGRRLRRCSLGYRSNAVKTALSAFIWLPSGESGTRTGVVMPASRHSSTPSRMRAAGPYNVQSASQRSVK